MPHAAQLPPALADRVRRLATRIAEDLGGLEPADIIDHSDGYCLSGRQVAESTREGWFRPGSDESFPVDPWLVCPCHRLREEVDESENGGGKRSSRIRGGGSRETVAQRTQWVRDRLRDGRPLSYRDAHWLLQWVLNCRKARKVQAERLASGTASPWDIEAQTVLLTLRGGLEKEPASPQFVAALLGVASAEPHVASQRDEIRKVRNTRNSAPSEFDVIPALVADGRPGPDPKAAARSRKAREFAGDQDPEWDADLLAQLAALSDPNAPQR